MKMNEILFGSAYYDEYMPYDRIETDFQMMKELGFNVIRIAESTWSTWEPADGVFDFTHLHRMLHAAEEYGIKVIIGTPTYAIPSWLYKKHPDILAVTKNGPELYGRRQNIDITNPRFRFYAERIIRKLMEEVKDHPQVIGFQLDNETRSGGGASPETQALFLETLKEKYPDIHDFNLEFGLNYWSNSISRWEDFPDVRGTINGSLSAAYKRFLRECITEFLTWQADIVKEYKTEDQFITHNFDFSWCGHSFGIHPEVNQKDAARCMDIAGVDIYHPTQDFLTGAAIAFGGALARALKKGNYLVLETEAQGQKDWLPYPGQLRLQAYSHLASGANSVMYWHWHSIHNSFESYWKGILSHDLLPNETFRELAAWRREMLPIADKLKNLQKDCTIGILCDTASLVGLEEFPVDEKNPLEYNRILRTMFDSLYEMNLEADLLFAEDSFEKYRLLIVPALYSASEKTLEKLRDYVKGGGHLLLGFKSGFADEELKIYHDAQPHLFTECIGATYDQFTRPVDVTITLDGKEYAVSHWMELVRPFSPSGEDAATQENIVSGETLTTDKKAAAKKDCSPCEVWAYYNHKYWKKYAAITHHAYGKGTAAYLGCFLEKDGFKALLKRLLSVAGIDVPDITFPIICKSGTNENGNTIRYYFNYSSEPHMFTYKGPDAKNLLSGERAVNGDNMELKDWDVILLEIKN